MPFNQDGFSIVDLGVIPADVIDSFSRLALDQYMGWQPLPALFPVQDDCQRHGLEL